MSGIGLDDVANTATEIATNLVGLYRNHGLKAPAHLDELREKMNEVRVGIIAIIPEEFSALLARFSPTTPYTGTKRSYQVCDIATPFGIRKVFITQATSQGNAFATQVASELIADVHPAFVLVVGIAGGVPDNDFSLGDVVVSKSILDMTIRDTGTSPEHQRRSGEGRQLHVEASRVVDQLVPMVMRTAQHWGSALPMAKPDSSGSFTTEDEKWNAKITQSFDSAALRTEPELLPGQILSSEDLVKDPKVAQTYQVTHKAFLAAEMESAGVSTVCNRAGIPFLAVRGISDIIGWKRSDLWKKYACHTAAAAARLIIEAPEFCAVPSTDV